MKTTALAATQFLANWGILISAIIMVIGRVQGDVDLFRAGCLGILASAAAVLVIKLNARRVRNSMKS